MSLETTSTTDIPPLPPDIPEPPQITETTNSDHNNAADVDHMIDEEQTSNNDDIAGESTTESTKSPPETNQNETSPTEHDNSDNHIDEDDNKGTGEKPPAPPSGPPEDADQPNQSASSAERQDKPTEFDTTNEHQTNNPNTTKLSPNNTTDVDQMIDNEQVLDDTTYPVENNKFERNEELRNADELEEKPEGTNGGKSSPVAQEANQVEKSFHSEITDHNDTKAADTELSMDNESQSKDESDGLISFSVTDKDNPTEEPKGQCEITGDEANNKATDIDKMINGCDSSLTMSRFNRDEGRECGFKGVSGLIR